MGMYKKTFLLIIYLFIPLHLNSAVLPEFYSLFRESNQLTEDDQGLVNWLENYSTSLKDYDGRFIDFLNKFEKEDYVTIAYAALHFSNTQKVNPQNKFLKKVFSELFLAHKDDLQGVHLLYPYFLQTFYEINKSDDKFDYKYFIDISKDPRGMNCPTYSYIHKHLTDRVYLKNNDNPVDPLLVYLLNSNRKNKVQHTLRYFLHRSPKNKINLHKEKVSSFYKKFPDLDLPYFSANSESEKHLKDISKSIKKRHCITAKNKIYKFLKNKVQKPSFRDFSSLIDKATYCFKRRSTRQAINFLNGIISRLEGHFGVESTLYVKYHIAKLYWNQDKNQKALKELDDLWSLSSKHNNSTYQSKILFLQSSIYDNQQEFDASIYYFQKFIKSFPTHEKVGEAKTTLILSYINRQDWRSILTLVKNETFSFRKNETPEPSDEYKGFLLFWAGRAAIEIGNYAQGLDYWKTAAKEHFSSYYGAISHYMIEKLTGKQFISYPLYSTNFQALDLVESSPPLIKKRVQRILLLLKIGLQKPALCEIEELPQVDKLSSKILKSLLLHASGKWLPAIKEYGAIPRAYRKTFPRGMEKILFPLKFENKIDLYAQKAGIDPALIYAIIRQESAFNPRAQSGAGARGLMQIMSPTARNVARRLPRHYVSQKMRSRLIRKSRRSSSLYDIETNVILGVNYIANLTSRFDDLPQSLAAYNAGPTNLKRWTHKISTSDPLYFIERIPYKETREYVKLVIRNYFYYKKWYHADSQFPHLDRLTEYILTKAQKLDKAYY